jgi:CheY-like chemotaxis protein
MVQAADGKQAFDYLSSNPPPNCVLLDLWMPVMDGWSLAREVTDGHLPSVPMLVVTAAGGHFAYPVPSRYVLRKPFNLERLLMMVAELIQQGRRGPTAD